MASVFQHIPPSQNGYGCFFFGAATAVCAPLTGIWAAGSSMDLDIVVGLPRLSRSGTCVVWYLLGGPASLWWSNDGVYTRGLGRSRTSGERGAGREGDEMGQYRAYLRDSVVGGVPRFEPSGESGRAHGACCRGERGKATGPLALLEGALSPDGRGAEAYRIRSTVLVSRP